MCSACMRQQSFTWSLCLFSELGFSFLRLSIRRCPLALLLSVFGFAASPLTMASDMLTSNEWATLKLWMIEAELKSHYTPYTAGEWVWHWASEDRAYATIIEMAEQWRDVAGWSAVVWLCHWIETAEILDSPTGPAAAPSPGSAAPQAMALALPQTLPLALPLLHRLHPLALALRPPAALAKPFAMASIGLTFRVATPGWGWRPTLWFNSGDWLLWWFVEDPRPEVRRLARFAREAGSGFSAASWLKLWLEQADIPAPFPVPDPAQTSASASSSPGLGSAGPGNLGTGAGTGTATASGHVGPAFGTPYHGFDFAFVAATGGQSPRHTISDQ